MTEKPIRRNRDALAFASSRSRNRAIRERADAPLMGEGRGFAREARPSVGNGSLIRRARGRCVASRRLWPTALKARFSPLGPSSRQSWTRNSLGSAKRAHRRLVELRPLTPYRDRTERGRAVRDASAVWPPWRLHPSPRQPHSPGDAGGRGARSACRLESTSRQR